MKQITICDADDELIHRKYGFRAYVVRQTEDHIRLQVADVIYDPVTESAQIMRGRFDEFDITIESLKRQFTIQPTNKNPNGIWKE